jgi:sugar phosphate isomerase/epimerase
MMTASWPYPFKLGVVAGEIHEDPAVSLPFAKTLGMTHVEFGSLWGRRITDIADGELEPVRALLRDLGLQVVMVGPDTFKLVKLGHLALHEIAGDAHFQAEMAVLRRSIEIARFFGAGLVRTFSFRRDEMVGLGNPSPRLPRGGEIPDAMLDKLCKAFELICTVAEQEGATLGLENVRSCWANSGRNTGRLVERVGSPRLKVVWDPANAFVSGEEPVYPDGYLAVRPYIAHVHLKDARVVDAVAGLTAWERIGNGQVEYRAQVQALIDDGYRGVVSIETHYEPPGKSAAEATQLTTEGLRHLLASLASSG